MNESQKRKKEYYDLRRPLALKARCDGEADAIMYEGFEPGEAICGNCGWSFPPEDPQTEHYKVWCSPYKERSKSGFCRQWSHPNNVSAGISPPWCEPYTKERLKPLAKA